MYVVGSRRHSIVMPGAPLRDGVPWNGGCATKNCVLARDHAGPCKTGSVEEEEYEVEYIVAERRKKSNIEYQVKWRGWPMDDCTWEPRAGLIGSADRALSIWSRLQERMADFEPASAGELRKLRAEISRELELEAREQKRQERESKKTEREEAKQAEQQRKQSEQAAREAEKAAREAEKAAREAEKAARAAEQARKESEAAKAKKEGEEQARKERERKSMALAAARQRKASEAGRRRVEDEAHLRSWWDAGTEADTPAKANDGGGLKLPRSPAPADGPRGAKRPKACPLVSLGPRLACPITVLCTPASLPTG